MYLLCMGIRAPVGPEDNLKKLALSFCHLDSRSNSAFRLGGAVLYPLSDFPRSLAVL